MVIQVVDVCDHLRHNTGEAGFEARLSLNAQTYEGG